MKISLEFARHFLVLVVVVSYVRLFYIIHGNVKIITPTTTYIHISHASTRWLVRWWQRTDNLVIFIHLFCLVLMSANCNNVIQIRITHTYVARFENKLQTAFYMLSKPEKKGKSNERMTHIPHARDSNHAFISQQNVPHEPFSFWKMKRPRPKRTNYLDSAAATGVEQCLDGASQRAIRQYFVNDVGRTISPCWTRQWETVILRALRTPLLIHHVRYSQINLLDEGLMSWDILRECQNRAKDSDKSDNSSSNSRWKLFCVIMEWANFSSTEPRLNAKHFRISLWINYAMTLLHQNMTHF